jgi:uncharacterized protein YceK
MVYETDTDMVAVWNGSAWRYIAATTPTNGGILQIVRGTRTSSTTNNTTSFATSNLTASITPKSSSSKIYVLTSICVFTGTATVMELQLRRGGTTVDTYGHALLNDSNVTIGYASVTSLDSPSSTSSLTYEIFFRRVTGAGNCIACFSDVNGTGLSTLTLMEIAA